VCVLIEKLARFGNFSAPCEAGFLPVSLFAFCGDKLSLWFEKSIKIIFNFSKKYSKAARNGERERERASKKGVKA
jgi:hypothetical protein